MDFCQGVFEASTLSTNRKSAKISSIGGLLTKRRLLIIVGRVIPSWLDEITGSLPNILVPRGSSNNSGFCNVLLSHYYVSVQRSLLTDGSVDTTLTGTVETKTSDLDDYTDR